jgi:hypothetical protein
MSIRAMSVPSPSDGASMNIVRRWIDGMPLIALARFASCTSAFMWERPSALGSRIAQHAARRSRHA